MIITEDAHNPTQSKSTTSSLKKKTQTPPVLSESPVSLGSFRAAEGHDLPPPYERSDPTSSESRLDPPIPATSTDITVLPNLPTPEAGPSLTSPLTNEFNAKATNYVYVVRQLGSIKATYAIDPTIQVPPSLLRALTTGEEHTRAHLKLETNTGSINADVTLLDINSTQALVHRSGKVILDVVSTIAGSATMKIHASNSSTRHRFRLVTSVGYGLNTLLIPRSFHGPIVFSIPMGYISVSKSLSSQMTTISETGPICRCFVGNMASSSATGGSNTSAQYDEIEIEARIGRITVLYEDEDVSEADVKVGSGLFGFLRLSADGGRFERRERRARRVRMISG